MDNVREVLQQQAPPDISNDTTSLIKINADTQSNKRTLSIWISFFIIVGLLYILTLTVPDSFDSKEDNQLLCPNDSQQQNDALLKYACQQFDIETNNNYGGFLTGYSKFNQFMLIQIILKKKMADKDKKINVKIPFNGFFYQIDENGIVQQKLINFQKRKLHIVCDKNQIYCDPAFVLYNSKISYENYAFVVSFLDQNPSEWPFSNQMNHRVIFVRKSYTQFLISVRYVFLVISCILFVNFLKKMRRLAKNHWVIEQNFICILSGFLFMFNNPFYALIILEPHMAGSFFDILFITNFVVLLLVFWLTILDRIVSENAQKQSRALTKSKIAFGILIYIFLLLSYVGYSYNYFKDPFIDFEDSFGIFYDICKYFGFALFGFYFLIILYYYVNIYKKFKSLIWRNRLFAVFSFYYIICLGLFLFTGSFNTFNSVGSRVLMFVGILNLYIYYMQYMYTPSEEGYLEAQQIINLELRNQPQIYEILDDNISGINIQQNQNNQEQQQQQIQLNEMQIMKENNNQNPMIQVEDQLSIKSEKQSQATNDVQIQENN